MHSHSQRHSATIATFWLWLLFAALLALAAFALLPYSGREGLGRLRVGRELDAGESLQEAHNHKGGFVIGELRMR